MEQYRSEIPRIARVEFRILSQPNSSSSIYMILNGGTRGLGTHTEVTYSVPTPMD